MTQDEYVRLLKGECVPETDEIRSDLSITAYEVIKASNWDNETETGSIYSKPLLEELTINVDGTDKIAVCMEYTRPVHNLNVIVEGGETIPFDKIPFKDAAKLVAVSLKMVAMDALKEYQKGESQSTEEELKDRFYTQLTAYGYAHCKLIQTIISLAAPYTAAANERKYMTPLKGVSHNGREMAWIVFEKGNKTEFWLNTREMDYEVSSYDIHGMQALKHIFESLAKPN